MLRKPDKRNSDNVQYSHDPPGHTCGLPCCGGDLHFRFRKRGRSGNCTPFQATDAELENFTLRKQREISRGKPAFLSGLSFSLQSPRASTKDKSLEFGSVDKSLLSNSDTQRTDHEIASQNFLKGREITLPHTLDLLSEVIKKDYNSDENNDFLDIDSDLDTEYYMSVPQNEASNEEREQNESVKLKPCRHAQVKGYTSSYGSHCDSQYVANLYDSLTFERESLDNISIDNSVASKKIERAAKTNAPSENRGYTEKKLKLSPVRAFGRHENWDQSTVTLKLGCSKLGMLYDTNIRETSWKEDARVSKSLRTNRKYPMPVSIPRVPVMQISKYAQGKDEVFFVGVEQTRQSKYILKHASPIRLEAINRELNDRILNDSTKKFNSYTSFTFLKSVDNCKNNTGKFEKLNSRGHSLDRVSHKRFKRQDVREIYYRRCVEDNM